MNLHSPGYGVTILLIIELSLMTHVSRASDWPQFLGPTRDGVYRDNDVSSVWPLEGPRVVWKKDVGQGFSAPVIADGNLILFHRVNDKERVECLDARSGKVRWTGEYPTHYQDDFGFDEGPRATPTVTAGHVYAYGAEGALTCWQLQNGKQLWSVDTEKDFGAPKGFFGRGCSPLVEGSAVILNIGAKGAGIVAFDTDSGKVLWKATDDAVSYSSPTAAMIQGKRYVFVFTRAGLVALDAATGKVFFNYPFRSRMEASVNAATPIIVGDLIFISASYGTGAALLEFNEGGPKKVWASDVALSNHYATCVHAGGFLYGFDGRQEQGPNLRCVELKTGKVAWSEEHFGAGTLLLAGTQLLILTEKGELIAAPASPIGFKPTARAQVLPFDCRAYPAIADGFFYARSKQMLVCLDLRVVKAK